MGGIMVRSGTRILWRLLTQKLGSDGGVRLTPDVDSRQFLVVKPSRGSEMLAFGPFCGVIYRGKRKIGL